MLQKILIANRGEIAVRILRAAADLGIETIAICAEDDQSALHVRLADHRNVLSGTGPRAYLDIERIVEIAERNGCDGVHPGYGFLAENAEFARRIEESGIAFVGPRPDSLARFGDKVRARQLARSCNVPILEGSAQAVTLDQARQVMQRLDGKPIMLKALAGGGGRGSRAVTSIKDLDAAFERCSSEANAAFGSDEIYVEQLLPNARHIEIQVLGDGTGEVVDFGERECSLQRRLQKLIEIAPAPKLAPLKRQQIVAAALRLAHADRYRSLGTFEFLVDVEHTEDNGGFYFMETNARVQVEHTVTEEAFGIDLVRLQLQLAGGESLAALTTKRAASTPSVFVIQCRVNMETMRDDGQTLPTSGALTVFDPPLGKNVRIDTYGYTGYQTNPSFDSLLAKVIVTGGSYEEARARAQRALSEFRIVGLETNRAFLIALLDHDSVAKAAMSTHFVDQNLAELVDSSKTIQDRLTPMQPASGSNTDRVEGMAGAQIDTSDPLAVLDYGRQQLQKEKTASEEPEVRKDGLPVVYAPMQGTIVSIEVAQGDAIHRHQTIVVMEAMKMEHEIASDVAGIVREVAVTEGDIVVEGRTLLAIEPKEVNIALDSEEQEAELDRVRPDLQRILDRLDTTYDHARDWAVERRRARNQRTTRENITQLIDENEPFLEYGQLVLAAQRRRRTLEDLIAKTSADGMVTGVGVVNGHLFDESACSVAVLAYDYTVLAGSQGSRNHRKTDRMLHIAEWGRMPLVFFTEGGGGRPGDTDEGSGGPHEQSSFVALAKLSGLVPLVGITSGRCFAGNTALLGICDVIIATSNSTIGMGGPSMIEGGNLGIFTPEEVGPMSFQVPNGVVDIAVEDEVEAVEVAKKYLSYFQGRVVDYECADQRLLRNIVPENRVRMYDIRRVISTLADTDSVLELRPKFGLAMVTAFARIEGRPLGIVANNPSHLGGAIDADAGDKAARFMQICDAFDIPILFLSDTPGIMVGPEAEKEALVRHANRMLVAGPNLTVPYFTIVLRKGYGIGAIAMGGGYYKQPLFLVSWPTGEFGGMGLEGQVKLGFRKELEAIKNPAERLATYERLVAEAYERGNALNTATTFGIDQVIDPAESRMWVSGILRAVRPPAPRDHKKRPYIDTW